MSPGENIVVMLEFEDISLGNKINLFFHCLRWFLDERHCVYGDIFANLFESS